MILSGSAFVNPIGYTENTRSKMKQTLYKDILNRIKMLGTCLM